MMWLISFFKEIGDAILKVFEFIGFLIQSLFEAISLGLEAIGTVTFYAVQLPQTWAAAFIAIITIALIFKVKG